jgi:hypothetical protein
MPSSWQSCFREYNYQSGMPELQYTASVMGNAELITTEGTCESPFYLR